jgi:8-oxo-dGTP diphosphatase
MMKTLNVARGVVRYKDRYLVLKIARDAVFENIGKWEAPGGKIVEGESPKEAAIREICEETALKCDVIIELPLLKLKSKEDEIVGHIFLLDAPSDEVKLSSEHSKYKWILPKEIDSVELTLPRKIVARYLKLAEENKN